MPRPRIIIVIIVLLVANCIVFGNIVMLLISASGEAAARITATRVPEPTFTPLATSPPATPTATPTGTPTPTIAPTAGASATLKATETRALSSYPTFAPVGTGTPLKYPFVYTVKSGDTLSGLADRFGVSRTKLMAANGLVDSNFIRVGQILIIPDPNL
jgi:LysM repeat protein